MSNASRTRQGLVALACARRDGDGRGGRERPEVLSRRSDHGSSTQRDVHRRWKSIWTSNLNLFPGGDQTPNVRAQNLNTIDEVPDSTWFTNRLGTYPSRSTDSSKAGVRRRPGAGRLDGDFGQERWRDAGVHRARFRGQVWFIKFDPPAMASTGTEVLVARLFWGWGITCRRRTWRRCGPRN